MIIDIENLNAGTWFPLEGGGEICLRVCAGDDYQAIRDPVTKVKTEVVFDPKTRQAQKLRTEDVDEKALKLHLWDFCIVDWKNLLDKHGQPIPCTKDMKLLLMGKSPTFFDHVSDCLAKLRGLEATEAEEEQKN
jgi:hypothetical protein